MDRRTEALPLVDEHYYTNQQYNYTGNLYLGYDIAGDTQATGFIKRAFESDFDPGAKSVLQPYPRTAVEFGYGTACGIYNWELFFHLPMLIAQKLSQELSFEDAMKWFHFVFDPKQELNEYEQSKDWVTLLPPTCRFWNFLPFFSIKDTKDNLIVSFGLTHDLTEDEKQAAEQQQKDLPGVIDDWRKNPFNPHLIARHRMSAYQKFVVIKYLDNLIAWADDLFRRDTFESINQATQLYLLAADLLGDRPQDSEPLARPPRLTFRELKATGLNAFSDALLEVESALVSNRTFLKTAKLDPPKPTQAVISSIAVTTLFFQIPRNERLDGFWDTVQDRLFKIRNSMNIDGIKRQLALFEPPIDPGLLVRAAAAGLDLGGVLAQLNAPLPCYRFAAWLQKATDLANEVRGFGGALLAALEKRDAEQLQLLRQSHEITMLELVRQVRRQQVTEAEENITALERSRDLAQERHDEYAQRSRINDKEATQLGLTGVATALETAQGYAHTAAGLASFIPDALIGMVGPFPAALTLTKIGQAIKDSSSSTANVLAAGASLTRGLANIAGMLAGFDRRWEDWKLQERLARKEMDQIDQQLIVANVRLDIAEKELENHETQMDHAREVQDFLKDKFTSAELYRWMVTELGRTYQQLYALAHDAAKTAERTFQFELGIFDTSFIQFGYTDSLRQGLLAGEKMLADLKRMDVAYLERHKRELEITKPISLAALNGAALQTLRETGQCDFELPEVLFDLDFPGHYFRRIKSVRLTIPCVTGPYTSVSAMLTLTGSAFRKDSTATGAYPFTGPDDARFVQDPVGIQSIATSTAQNDPGLFELNFRDERYLPFEGAGAVSKWHLELPDTLRQFDYGTISDVVMHMSYTARDGGQPLRDAAGGAIVDALNQILRLFVPADDTSQTGLVRAFSLRREFPDVLHKLLTAASPAEVVNLTISPEHLPFAVRETGETPTVKAVRVVAESSSDLTSPTVHVGSASAVLGKETARIWAGALDVSSAPPPLPAHGQSAIWALTQSGLDPKLVDDVVFVVTYTLPTS